MRQALCLGLLVGVLLTSPNAHATVVGCTPYRSGDVVINHCSNHGFHAMTIERSLPAAAAGLEIIRKRMVKLKLIDSRPVLINLPWRPTKNYTLAALDDCIRDTGDSGDEHRIGKCYAISSNSQDYPTLRGLVFGLKRLSKMKNLLLFRDVAPLTRAARFVKGIRRRIDIYPSPDKRHRVDLMWRDGTFYAVLRTAKGQWLRRLRMPAGLVATEPVWSTNSKHIALASLSEIVVQPRRGRTPKPIKLTPGVEGIGKIVLAFDSDGQQLVVSQASHIWGEVRTFVVDLQNRNQQRQCEECSPLLWGGGNADRIAAEAVITDELP